MFTCSPIASSHSPGLSFSEHVDDGSVALGEHLPIGGRKSHQLERHPQLHGDSIERRYDARVARALDDGPMEKKVRVRLLFAITGLTKTHDVSHPQLERRDQSLAPLG